MNDIERWSIERLSKSLANPHTARRSFAASRPFQASRILASFARAIKHFKDRRTRQARLGQSWLS
jgi:hypothetical protein